MSCYAIGIDVDGNQHKFEISYKNIMFCHNMALILLTVYDEDNELNELYCHKNYLEELIIIGGKFIKEIHCDINKLKQLDLSMCKKIKYFIL